MMAKPVLPMTTENKGTNFRVSKHDQEKVSALDSEQLRYTQSPKVDLERLRYAKSQTSLVECFIASNQPLFFWQIINLNNRCYYLNTLKQGTELKVKIHGQVVLHQWWPSMKPVLPLTTERQ